MPSQTKDLTFGLELEITRLSSDADRIIRERNFKRHRDGSIQVDTGDGDDSSGTELVTPTMSVSVTFNPDGDGTMTIDHRDTARIVADLCACAAKVNKTCGLHVHLGRPESSTSTRSKWEPERVRTFLIVCRQLEQKMFELSPSSRQNNRFCKKISEEYNETDLVSYYPMGNVSPNKYDNSKRYCWVNLIETRRTGTNESGGRGPATGTLEIRLLGNVRRYDYIWAWTSMWLKMAAYCAFYPPTLAIAHCTGVTMKRDMELVAQAKSNATRSTTQTPDPSTPSTRRSVTFDEDGFDGQTATGTGPIIGG